MTMKKMLVMIWIPLVLIIISISSETPQNSQKLSLITPKTSSYAIFTPTFTPVINITPTPMPSANTSQPTTITTSTPAQETITPEPTSQITLEDFQPISSYTYEGTRLKMPLSIELQRYTYEMANKHNVPFEVIMGIMGIESGWRANIGTSTVNGKTYVGMGMLRDIYHADRFAQLGIDIYTPKGNIEAICILIREKLDIFDNNVNYALMAYNIGISPTQQKIKEGIYETEYSKRVLRYIDSFQ